MIVLDRQQVQDRLGAIDVLGVVRRALLNQAAGLVTMPAESYLSWSVGSESARSIAMHAAIRGPEPVAGVKIINANPANVDRGLARASGLTLVFDHATGVVNAVMPAEDVSAARTAAVSAIAVECCASPQASTVAVIGCGPIADWHLRLLLARNTYRSVTLFDVRRERAEALRAQCEEHYAVAVKVVGSAHDAVSVADVVIAATTVTSPYISYDWLTAGATVVNVSLDDVGEDVLLRADRLFVDDWSLVAADEHRLLGKLARAGKVTGPSEPRGDARSVDGTIAQLVAGDVLGRTAAADIVVVNPFGMAVSDIALAHAVLNVSEHP